MVVDRFHIMHVTVLETEDDPLQAIHAEGVESGAIPGQRVQTIVRQGERLQRGRVFKSNQGGPDATAQVGRDPAPIVVANSAFDTLVGI